MKRVAQLLKQCGSLCGIKQNFACFPDAAPQASSVALTLQFFFIWSGERLGSLLMLPLFILLLARGMYLRGETLLCAGHNGCILSFGKGGRKVICYRLCHRLRIFRLSSGENFLCGRTFLQFIEA